MSNSLHPYQNGHSVSLDLGPNCLLNDISRSELGER